MLNQFQRFHLIFKIKDNSIVVIPEQTPISMIFNDIITFSKGDNYAKIYRVLHNAFLTFLFQPFLYTGVQKETKFFNIFGILSIFLSVVINNFLKLAHLQYNLHVLDK